MNNANSNIILPLPQHHPAIITIITHRPAITRDTTSVN
jgi:hypothetical protein